MIALLFFVRIAVFFAYFSQNALDFILGWQGELFSSRIGCVEDEAAESTRQLIQREGIRMFSEKAPNLRLFPSPAPAKGFQCQNSAVLPKLNSRRREGKRIARLLPNSVAPEIQPCVCLSKLILALCKPLCSVSGQAEENHTPPSHKPPHGPYRARQSTLRPSP